MGDIDMDILHVLLFQDGKEKVRKRKKEKKRTFKTWYVVIRVILGRRRFLH